MYCIHTSTTFFSIYLTHSFTQNFTFSFYRNSNFTARSSKSFFKKKFPLWSLLYAAAWGFCVFAPFFFFFYLVISVCSVGSGDLGCSFNVARVFVAQRDQEPNERRVNKSPMKTLSPSLMEWYPAEYWGHLQHTHTHTPNQDIYLQWSEGGIKKGCGHTHTVTWRKRTSFLRVHSA